MGLISILLLVGFAALPVMSSTLEPIKEINNSLFASNSKDVEDGWYYLPPYSNYAPSGLPDFNQRQDANWTNLQGKWSWCAPTSVANVLWWFDSKHSDPNGLPGDGNDTFNLVRDYNTLVAPNPGPHSDDHNFNNVNDLQTSWQGDEQNCEFIELFAWYANVDFCRVNSEWFKILAYKAIGGGASSFRLAWGINTWMKDAGLKNSFKVNIIFRPSFSTINERLRNNEGIILGTASIDPDGWGHCVAVAGVNSDGYIAISDPSRDIKNPSSDPTEHNDASIVSHDIWQVDFTPPSPWWKAIKWWLPEYRGGGLVYWALIISER